MGEENVTIIIGALEARRNFGRLLQEASNKERRFIVERSGKPMAVIIGIEEWENIVETLAELTDSDYLDSIREARREIQSGDVVSLEELWAEVKKTNGGRTVI